MVYIELYTSTTLQPVATINRKHNQKSLLYIKTWISKIFYQRSTKLYHLYLIKFTSALSNYMINRLFYIKFKQ